MRPTVWKVLAKGQHTPRETREGAFGFCAQKLFLENDDRPFIADSWSGDFRAVESVLSFSGNVPELFETLLKIEDFQIWNTKCTEFFLYIFELLDW